MNEPPSGRTHTPDVSMISGESTGASRSTSKTNTHRRRASTGSSTPAIAATAAAHGPAASTTDPQARFEPSLRVTAATPPRSTSMPTTSSVSSSAPRSRALARSVWTRPYPSNHPSPDRPSDPSAMPSVDSQGNRAASSDGVRSTTSAPSATWIAWFDSRMSRVAADAKYRYPPSRMSRPSRSRMKSNEYADIRMFSGVENWRRVPAALRAEEARRYVGSRSTMVTRPSNAGSSRRWRAVAPPIAPPPMTTTSRAGVTEGSLEVEGHAAQSGLPVEMGGDPLLTEAVEDAFGKREVHPAHEVAMVVDQGMERAVSEAQRP